MYPRRLDLSILSVAPSGLKKIRLTLKTWRASMSFRVLVGHHTLVRQVALSSKGSASIQLTWSMGGPSPQPWLNMLKRLGIMSVLKRLKSLLKLRNFTIANLERPWRLRKGRKILIGMMAGRLAVVRFQLVFLASSFPLL